MTLATGVIIPLDRIAEVCRRYHVRQLGLFGSAAWNEMRPDSDVDLLVEFLPGAPIGLFEFDDLERELSSLLSAKVDLVSKRGLKPLVRPGVLNDLKVLYEV